MADTYTITYVFGETQSVGTLLGNGDRILITCVFTVEDTGNNITYLASAHGLQIKKYGTISMEYDFDEFFMVPAEYEFEVADFNGEFNSLLYDGILAEKVTKEFYVKVEIKYSSNAIYEEEFSGYNEVDVIEYAPLTKIHSFTILPNTKALNESFIFPVTYDPAQWRTDKLETAPNNPLNIGINRIGDAYKWDWVPIYELIERIFQVINPDISIQFIQNWLFFGKLPVPPNSEKNDISFMDLKLDGNWIGTIFAEPKFNGIDTIGDILKVLAFEFGSMAIVKNQNEAYFKQMFYFDENNLQELGTILDDGYQKKYKYSKINYASVHSKFYQQDTGTLNRYVQQDYNPAGFAPGTKTNKGTHISRNLSEPTLQIFDKTPNYRASDVGLDKEIISVADAVWGIHAQVNYVSNIRSLYSDNDHYYIIGIKNPFLTLTHVGDVNYNYLPSGYYPMSVYLAEYYYAIKGFLYKTQVHTFKVDGLHYNFLQGFQKFGYNYSIISLSKNIDEGITTIEALRISTIEQSTQQEGDGQEVNILLSSQPVASYGSEILFNYAQADQGAIKIATIDETEYLESIIIQVEVPFGANQINNFRIYDGTEDLFTYNEMMGKFTRAATQRKEHIKRYGGSDTIYMEISSGSETPTQGQGYVLIKKLKKAST